MAVIQNTNLNTGLTNYARGTTFGGHIADLIFKPRVVDTLQGEFWDFGDGDLDTTASIGPLELEQQYPRIDIDLGKGLYSINNFGLATHVNELEMSTASSLVGLEQRKVRRMMRILRTQRELSASKILTDAALYADSNKINFAGVTAGTSRGGRTTADAGARWGETAADSTDESPVKDVQLAKDAVRAATGNKPNSMVMPEDVLSRLRVDPFLVDKIKFTQRGILMDEDIADFFEIERSRFYVGAAQYNSAKRGQARKRTDIWTKSVVLFWEDPDLDGLAGGPAEDTSFATQFRLRGYEDVRVSRGEVVNPPGLDIVAQDPYQHKVHTNKAGKIPGAYLLQNVIA